MKIFGSLLLIVLFFNVAVAIATEESLTQESYTVHKGDTLEKRAEEQFDNSGLWVQLARYNGITISSPESP